VHITYFIKEILTKLQKSEHYDLDHGCDFKALKHEIFDTYVFYTFQCYLVRRFSDQRIKGQHFLELVIPIKKCTQIVK